MDQAPTHVDLFSGIGGFALAAQWAGFRTIAFCEIDKYCQKVLAKNFLADAECQPSTIRGNDNSNAGNGSQWGNHATRSGGDDSGQSRTGTNATIHGNIFDFDGTQYQGCDLITGGFPCQPFSVAGKRRGAADDRAIWPEMFRVIKEARPAWVLGENVPGIVPMELDNVLSDLEGIGYACRPFVIPACAVDARHMRSRLWVIGRFVGDTSSAGPFPSSHAGVCRGEEGTGSRDAELERRSDNISDANQQGLEGQRQVACGIGTQFNDTGDHCRWLPEPNVGRVANGIPSRVDRLKGLGNAIVPQVASEIMREIRKLI
jgi:DNA (cytosine-5)-methyltransferase 1